MRVMYATQEHNLLAQRSHKLYISHHHKTKASKNRKKRLQLMHVYKKLDSLVSMSIFGYKLKLEDCNLI